MNSTNARRRIRKLESARKTRPAKPPKTETKAKPELRPHVTTLREGETYCLAALGCLARAQPLLLRAAVELRNNCRAGLDSVPEPERVELADDLAAVFAELDNAKTYAVRYVGAIASPMFRREKPKR